MQTPKLPYSQDAKIEFPDNVELCGNEFFEPTTRIMTMRKKK